MDELEEALNNMTTGMGAAVEMTGFLFEQLIKHGFTRGEAFVIAKEYLLGMIKGEKRDDS